MGLEFVNKTLAALLTRRLIHFTKSIPRHTNDNNLVDTKNGAVVHKQLRYAYISQRCAEAINEFNKDFFNPYINLHRPCFSPVSVIDHRSKVKKNYPYKGMISPYKKLKSLSEAESYLCPDITLERLEAIANRMSDNQFAKRMVKARSNLFQQISRFANRSKLARLAGLEPTTSASAGLRSILLSYKRLNNNSAEGEI